MPVDAFVAGEACVITVPVVGVVVRGVRWCRRSEIAARAAASSAALEVAASSARHLVVLVERCLELF